MMTGEYFLSEKQKAIEAHHKKREQKEDRKTQKVAERNKNLTAPEDAEKGQKYENKKPKDIDALKDKFLKKK